MSPIDAVSLVSIGISAIAILISLASVVVSVEARQRAEAAQRRTRELTDLSVRVESAAPSITCPVCGRASHHPDYVRHGYCAACNAFTTGLFSQP